jgi:hypothetical protein
VDAERNFSGVWSIDYDTAFGSNPEDWFLFHWSCSACQSCCAHAQERVALMYLRMLYRFHPSLSDRLLEPDPEWTGPLPYSRVLACAVRWLQVF